MNLRDDKSHGHSTIEASEDAKDHLGAMCEGGWKIHLGNCSAKLTHKSGSVMNSLGCGAFTQVKALSDSSNRAEISQASNCTLVLIAQDAVLPNVQSCLACCSAANQACTSAANSVRIGCMQRQM